MGSGSHRPAPRHGRLLRGTPVHPPDPEARRTGDTAGLSTARALLAGINNAYWCVYFVTSGYWFALINSASVTVLGGSLGIMLNRRNPLPNRNLAVIAIWTCTLATAAGLDRRLLSALLAGAFQGQVVPAVVAAYRSAHPSGIARGTWLLILAELSCWAAFGAAKRDASLFVVGASGVITALLILNRTRLARITPSRA
jgi:hypothetical protein